MNVEMWENRGRWAIDAVMRYDNTVIECNAIEHLYRAPSRYLLGSTLYAGLYDFNVITNKFVQSVSKLCKAS